MRKNITTEDYHYFLTDEFSQWYPSNFIDEKGRKFNCCEQWMMLCKAELFGDTEIANLIITATSPDEMKALGRKVKGLKQLIIEI